MSKIRLTHKWLYIAALATLVLAFVATSPVLAFLYRATFTVVSNLTDYTNLPVSCLADVDWLVANGFITTSTANDTRVETLGGSEQIYMMASDRIMAFVPSLPGANQLNWYLTTGNTELPDFPVITGYSGNVTVVDADALELGNNFSIEFEGWVQEIPFTAGVDAYASSKNDVATLNHVVTMPTGFVAGDLLIISFGGYNSLSNSPVASCAGWTVLYQDNTVTNTRTVFYKTATGGDTATVVTTQTCVSAHMCLAIGDWISISGTGVASGGASQPDSPSHTCATSAVKWISTFMSRDATAVVVSAYPTDYTGIGYISNTAGFVGVGCAYNDTVNLAGSQNPGAFTCSSSQDWWAAVTIAVTIPAYVLVYKLGSVAIYNTLGDDDLNASVVGVSTKTVTATNVTVGEYKIEVYADGTNLTIEVDDVVEDTIALAGVSATINANNWTLGSYVPYFNYYEHTVNGIPIVRYQPISLIDGTTLPNELNPGTYDGAINWGTNPSGVTVTLGSLTVPESTVTTDDDDDTRPPVTPPVEVSDWFLEPDIGVKLATHPLRPLVTLMSNGTTITEVQAWRFLGLALLLLVTVSAAIGVRGHLLIAGLACGGMVALLVQQTVWPGWTLVFIIPAILAGVFAERTPSIG